MRERLYELLALLRNVRRGGRRQEARSYRTHDRLIESIERDQREVEARLRLLELQANLRRER